MGRKSQQISQRDAPLYSPELVQSLLPTPQYLLERMIRLSDLKLPQCLMKECEPRERKRRAQGNTEPDPEVSLALSNPTLLGNA